MIEPVTMVDVALKEASIPIVSVSMNGNTPVVEYAANATQQQRNQGAAIIAALDLTPQGLAAFDFAQDKKAAKNALDSNDPQELARRMTDRALFELIISTREALNARFPLLPALSTPTWQQLQNAIRSRIDNE